MDHPDSAPPASTDPAGPTSPRIDRAAEPQGGRFGPAPALLDHPYADFLEAVEKPSRYLGAEHGAARKPWASVPHHVCLAFPDLYEVGASHLGLRILYTIANEAADVLAERCFCPATDLESELRRRRLPMVSLESATPLHAFDVLGFSLQYELTYTNVLTMLELGGVPLRSADRPDGAPLVLGGGPGATHPEPVAAFFDAFVVGDGERALLAVVRRWRELRDRGLGRAERLRAISAIEGVYVPSSYRTEVEAAHGREVAVPIDSSVSPTVRRTHCSMEEFPFPAWGPVGGPEAVFDRVSIEIARGCEQGCRFCQAGSIYRPMRERSAMSVEAVVREAVRHCGTDELSLTALSPADVTTLGPLLRSLGPELCRAGVSLSVSSLRAYGLSAELLEELTRLRAAGLTLAPEAGSQRLRNLVNKNVTEEQLCSAVERACRLGWRKLKLYFMIGLPTETDDDVRAIVRTAASVARAGRRAAGRAVAVTVSVSTFVPKPHTPLQWADMAGAEEIEQKQRLLREAIRAERALKLRVHSPRTSLLEGALCRADRSTADIIETAWRRGARFDSWEDQLDFELWSRAFADHGRTIGAHLRGFPVGSRLPWGHIETAVREGFLRRELGRALRARPSPPCGTLGARDTVICYRCGAACDLADKRDRARARAVTHEGLALPPESTPAEVRSDAGETAPAERPANAHPGRGGAPGGRRVRLEWSKTGPSAMLSHLDMVRELPRSLRRAGARLALTTGFHPKPAMSFGPALALGVPSLQELVDVRLLAPDGPEGLERLLAELRKACPPGLRFLRAAWLPEGEPSVSRRVRQARYALLLGRPGSDPSAELREKLLSTLGKQALPWTRRAGTSERSVDLRPSLIRAELASPSVLEALEAAGLPPIGPVVEVDVALGPGPVPRPAELGPLLLDVPGRSCRPVRYALLSGDETARGGDNRAVLFPAGGEISLGREP